MIAALIGVSTNRKSEWQRMWKAARNSSSNRVYGLLQLKDVSLSELIDALGHEDESIRAQLQSKIMDIPAPSESNTFALSSMHTTDIYTKFQSNAV